MIQKNYIYPKFEAGQVLSSNLLNKTVGFLEEQDRLTRANIIGTGIIDGLSYTYKNGKLTIFPGTAITADGFLIHYPKEKTYTICSKDVNLIKDNIPLDDKNDIEASPSLLFLKKHASYILFENNDDAFGYNATDSGFPNKLEDDYVVTLVVDFPETALITCKEVSCDRYVKQTRIEIHPVLILKKISSSIVFPKPYRKITPINHIAELKSFKNFSCLVNINTISRRTKSLFIENCRLINESLDKVLEQFVNKDTYLDWKTIMPEYRDKIKKFNDCKKKFIKWGNLNEYSNELPQYFLLFLDDVRCAINEFISYYNSFVKKYPYIRSSHELIDRTVAINEKNKMEDEYLYRFCPVQKDLNFEVDCKTLDKLFCRIYELSVAFLGHRYIILKNKAKKKNKVNDDFKISFEIKRLNCPMGENVIPFYYDKEKIKSYWDAFSLYDKDPSCKLNEIDLYDDENNVILFQNCYGEDVDRVKNEFNNYIKDKNITSIRIKPVSIGKRSLNPMYASALKHIYSESIIKKIQNKLSYLYEDTGKVRVINDIFVVGKNGVWRKIKLENVSLKVRRRFLKLYEENNVILKEGKAKIFLRKNKTNDTKVKNIQYLRLVEDLKQPEITNAKRILKVAKAIGFNVNNSENKIKSIRAKVYSLVKAASNDTKIFSLSVRNQILNSIKDINLDDFILFYEYIQECFRYKEVIEIKNHNDRNNGRFRTKTKTKTKIERLSHLINSETVATSTNNPNIKKWGINHTYELDESLWKLNRCNIYCTPYFASFFALKSYFELNYQPEYENTIYCGGTKTKSNTYLLYHQSGVVNPIKKTIGHKKRFFMEIFNKI